MLEYSEAPPLARLYHEVFQLADIQDGENSSSRLRKLPVPSVEEKDQEKPVERELPSSNPKETPTTPQRPKRTPTRLLSPDPILPGLQIMISSTFQAKVIVYRS